VGILNEFTPTSPLPGATPTETTTSTTSPSTWPECPAARSTNATSAPTKNSSPYSPIPNRADEYPG
jgi:hypothetical protein